MQYQKRQSNSSLSSFNNSPFPHLQPRPNNQRPLQPITVLQQKHQQINQTMFQTLHAQGQNQQTNQVCFEYAHGQHQHRNINRQPFPPPHTRIQRQQNTQTTLKSPYIQHQQSNRALSQPPHPKMHQQLINNQASNDPHGQHQRSGQPSSHTQQQQPSDGPSSQPSHNDHQQQQQQQKRAFKLPCTHSTVDHHRQDVEQLRCKVRRGTGLSGQSKGRGNESIYLACQPHT